MHYPQKQNESKGKNVENTTESGYGEMIYMEPGGNQMMSPVTEGRQTIGAVSASRSPAGTMNRSIVGKVRMDLKEKNDCAELVSQKPIQTLTVEIPSRGNSDARSPKTINCGDTERQTEYNIRTLNARRSPKGQMYQTMTTVQEQGTLIDQPMNYGSFMGPESSSYALHSSENVLVTTIGAPLKTGYQTQGVRETHMIMNPRNDREHLSTLNKMSPNKNVDEMNSSGGYDSQSQLNNLKNVMGKNVAVHNMGESIVQDQQYRNDVNQIGEILNARGNPNKEAINDNEIKKLVKKITKVYDPAKTKEGALISESQLIVPGANDDLFNARYRVLQKMNKLSTILLSKRTGNRENYFQQGTLNHSIDESRKTFNRQTLNQHNLKEKKIPLRRSPEQRFLFVTLAMLSSKGLNCEDRTILRKMRLDKGGVVDLAQEKKKKGKYKITKITRRPRPAGYRDMRPNPKFREKAAKVIQNWWRELKDRYKQILKKIILIQSWWRGRWVRKYMYDILYLSLMYQSFCQIIQKVLVKHVQPEVFNKLMEGRKNVINSLKRCLLKDERFKQLRIRPCWNKWLDLCKSYRDRGLRSRNIIDIRARKEREKLNQKIYMQKWRYLINLEKDIEKADDQEGQKRKFFGLISLLNASEIHVKRVGLRTTKPKLEKYFAELLKQTVIKKILQSSPNLKKILLQNYFNKYRNQVHKLMMKSLRDKIFDLLTSGVGSKLRNRILQKAFSKWLKIMPKNSNMDYYKGSEILQRAVWRKTHKDPLNALNRKEESDQLQRNLVQMLGLKDKYIKNHYKDYLLKWYKITRKIDKDTLKNQMYFVLLNTILGKLKKRILSNRFSHWRKVPKINVADIFDRYNKMISFVEKVKNKVLRPHREQFIENIKSTVAPKSYKKAANVLIKKYNLTEKQSIGGRFKQWLEQVNKLKVKAMKDSWIKSIMDSIDKKNKKSTKEHRLHQWYEETLKYNLEEEKKKSELVNPIILSKEKSTVLMKSVINNKEREEDNRKKKIMFDLWRNQSHQESKKKKININQAAEHLKNHNKLTNGNYLFKSVTKRSKEKLKKTKLKGLNVKNQKYEKINLLHYFLKWKMKVKAIQAKDNNNVMRKRLIKNYIKKSDKISLIRAWITWKYKTEQKKNTTPLRIGVFQLKNSLLKKYWKTFKNKVNKINVKIPEGMSLIDAITHGKLNEAKSLVIRNLVIHPYFRKWKKKVKKIDSQDLKTDFVKKTVFHFFKKGDKVLIRHYFNKWKETKDKINKETLKKDLHMKLMFNFHKNGSKILIRNYYERWKKDYNNYIKQLNETNKAMNKIRQAISQPLLNRFKKIILNQAKFNKIKKIFVNSFRKNDLNNLDYVFQTWKKNSSKLNNLEKERKYKCIILRNLTKHRNLKNKEDLNNYAKEVLLRWRIKSTPYSSIDKIKNYMDGCIILERAVRRPNHKDVIRSIMEHLVNTSGRDLIRMFVRKIAPKMEGVKMKNYFEIWREKTEEKPKTKDQLKKLFEDYILSINSKLYEPVHELIDAMKAYDLLKNNKSKTISDYCRGIINIKRQMEKLKRTLLLRKLLRSMDVFYKLKAHKALPKWRRIARITKADEDAKTIQRFIREKLNKKTTKQEKFSDVSKLLTKYIQRVVFMKLNNTKKEKTLQSVIKRTMRSEGFLNKKTLHDYFLRWKNLMPELRKKDAADKIQSVLRGHKVRKQMENKKTINVKIKYLSLTLVGKYLDKRKIYFYRWLAEVKKEKLKENADTIQNYLRDRLKKFRLQKAKDKLYDLVKKYLVKILITSMRKSTNVRGDRGSIMYNTLEDIYIRRPYQKLVNSLKWITKIKTIKKIQPKIHESLRKYYLPFYLKKWYENSVGYRNRKLILLQNWIKGRLALWRRKSELQKNKFLTKYLLKLTNDRDLRLKLYFYYWNSVKKYLNLNDQAGAIQRLWKGWTSRKNVERLLAKKKLQVLFKNKIKNNIVDIITESNNKFAALLRRNLKTTKSNIDKRYSTNNIIDFTNDALRNFYLLKLTGNQAFGNTKSFLRNSFDKWTKSTSKAKAAIVRIQSFYRGYKGRAISYKLYNVNDKLYKIVMRFTEDYNSKKLIAFRNWYLINKVEKCKESSIVIQDWLLPRIMKRVNDKLKNYFLNRSKQIVNKKLNTAAKIYKLKKAITKNSCGNAFEKFKFKKKIIGWKLELSKVVNDIDGSQSKNILTHYFDIWKKKKNQVIQKESEDITRIQCKYRQYLARIFINKLKARKAKLLTMVFKLINTDEGKLRVALHLWKHNSKVKQIDDANKIIYSFIGDILKKRRKRTDFNKRNNFKKGLKKLDNLKGQKQNGFNAIKSESKRKIFTKFNDLTRNKRLNNLKDAFNTLKEYRKQKLIFNSLIHVPTMKFRIKLDSYFKKWKSIAKDIAVEEEIKEKKNTFIFTSLNDIINIKIFKRRGILGEALNKWLNIVKKEKLIKAGKKINRYLDSKYRTTKAKKNWRKLSELYALHNGKYQIIHLLKRMKLFLGLKKLQKPIDRCTKRDAFNDFKTKTKKETINVKVTKIVKFYDKRNYDELLKDAFTKWKNIKISENKKEKSIIHFVNPIWQRLIIIGAERVNNASLIKKLFHDIPYIRAKDFFKKIKTIKVNNEKRTNLGKTLFKSRRVFKDKKTNNFKEKIYRLYVYKILDKFVNKIKKKTMSLKAKDGKSPFTTVLFDNMKKLSNNQTTYSYQGEHSLDRKSPTKKFRYKASVSNPKEFYLRADNKDINKLLLPYFIDYINEKIKKRKKEALEKIKENDVYAKFCHLYKKHTFKQMLQPKRELFDALKARNQYNDTHGGKMLEMFMLFRKYFIKRLLCRNLNEPSKLYRLLYMFKVCLMHKNIARQRFIREIIRKWRFMAFSKKMARRKLELMYKNLHLSYLQMANEVFGDEESDNPSVIKEFERFGNGIGMFVNEDPSTAEEIKFCKGISKKYIFESVIIDEKKEEMEDNSDYYVDKEEIVETVGKYKMDTLRSRKRGKVEGETIGEVKIEPEEEKKNVTQEEKKKSQSGKYKSVSKTKK